MRTWEWAHSEGDEMRRYSAETTCSRMWHRKWPTGKRCCAPNSRGCCGNLDLHTQTPTADVTAQAESSPATGSVQGLFPSWRHKAEAMLPVEDALKCETMPMRQQRANYLLCRDPCVLRGCRQKIPHEIKPHQHPIRSNPTPSNPNFGLKHYIIVVFALWRHKIVWRNEFPTVKDFILYWFYTKMLSCFENYYYLSLTPMSHPRTVQHQGLNSYDWGVFLQDLTMLSCQQLNSLSHLHSTYWVPAA